MKLVLFGSTDQVNSKAIVEAIKQIHPDFEVMEIGRELVNYNINYVREQYVKWKKDEKMSEFVQKPENVKQALTVYNHLQTKLQNKFTLRDMHIQTTWNYKTCENIIENLFAFGLLAFNVEGKNKTYWFTKNTEDKINFFQNKINEYEKDIEELKKLQQELLLESTGEIPFDAQVIEDDLTEEKRIIDAESADMVEENCEFKTMSQNEISEEPYPPHVHIDEDIPEEKQPSQNDVEEFLNELSQKQNEQLNNEQEPIIRSIGSARQEDNI